MTSKAIVERNLLVAIWNGDGVSTASCSAEERMRRACNASLSEWERHEFFSQLSTALAELEQCELVDNRVSTIIMATWQIRKRIADAETADKPFVRDPWVQSIKVLLNTVDSFIARRRKARG